MFRKILHKAGELRIDAQQTAVSSQTGEALGIFKSCLDLTSSILAILPVQTPKAAVDAVKKILTKYETMVNNVKSETDVKQEVKKFCEEINASLSSESIQAHTEAIQVHVETLSKNLREISESCTISSRRRVSRFIRSDDDAVNLADIAEQMRRVTEAFQTNTLIRIERASTWIERNTAIIEQDTANLRHGEEERRLRDLLSPVLVARHDSPFREVHIATCANGTRVELLRLINEWAESSDSKDIVFWLNGRAGEGKSTIANTIATFADERGLLGGSFFFSRQGERSLRTAALVIPSLVYQLTQHNPSFRAAVLELLKKDSRWTHLPLPAQAKKFATALESIPASSPPPLVVLDAIDECDLADAVILLSALLGSSFRRVPGKAFPLRILITSRPETDLVATFEEHCTKEYRLYEMSHLVVAGDVRLYLERSLLQVRGQLRLPNPEHRWFTDVELDAVATLAGTLFIYAATVVRLLKAGTAGPKATLTSILTQRPLRFSDYAGLDSIYCQIINHFSPDLSLNERTVSHYYVKVLGSILFLQDMLPINAIARLIDLDPDDVIATLRPLQSIITQPNNLDSPPTFYHKSFYDYVTSERCVPPALRFYEAERHAYLAQQCLIVMTNGLRENIADIEDATVDISTILGLVERIPREIAYASRFWGYHLRRSTRSDDRSGLAALLTAFIGLPLVYWIEICGVLGGIGAAIHCVQDALDWMVRPCGQTEGELSATSSMSQANVIRETYRLLLVHGSSINANPLQLYSSVFPTLPITSPFFGFLSSISFAQAALQVQMSREQEQSPHVPLWTDHSGHVRSVMFSSDGKKVVSGLDDHTICIWDVASGAGSSNLKGHDSLVMSVAFSPDGMQLVSASADETIRIWDIASAGCTSILKGHHAYVRSVAFSPNSKQVVSGSADRTIRIWDPALGACTAILNDHSDDVTSVAFSPSGNQVISGSWDRTVRIWDVASGRWSATLEGHTRDVNSVAFSPDGEQVASGSDDYTVRIWDFASRVCACTLEGHGDWVRSVSFSPDGKKVVSGSDDHTVRIWDVSSGICISTLSVCNHLAMSVAFSPDGKQVVSGSSDNIVRIFDLVSETPTSIFDCHRHLILCVGFSSNGKQVVSGSWDKTVRIWDVASGTCRLTLEGHSDWVKSVAFSPDSKHVVSGSSDCTIRIWDVASGTCSSTLEGHGRDVTFVTFSPDGKQVISSSEDSTVHIWNVASGACMPDYNGHSRDITPLAYSANMAQVTAISPPSGSRFLDRLRSIAFRKNAAISDAWNSSDLNMSQGTSIISDLNWSVMDRWLGFSLAGSFSRVCRLPARFDHVSSNIASQGELVAIGTKDGTVTVLDVSNLILRA